ncbi:unnamed protein product [Owenia fusiformis]|uniref:RNA helicase n=1 Tax=Owenia fusiformis TaxID=6347 RepID=A0A8S4P2R3_OWEFU|nr:unnamed protein product [Owenia fusiformis]
MCLPISKKPLNPILQLKVLSQMCQQKSKKPLNPILQLKVLSQMCQQKKQEAIELDTQVNMLKLNKATDILEPCHPPVICVSNIPEDKDVAEMTDGLNIPAYVLHTEESNAPNVDIIVKSDTTISTIVETKNSQMESLAHNPKYKSFDSYASENLPTGFILETTPEDKPIGPITVNHPLNNYNNENLKSDNAQNDSKNKTSDSLSSSVEISHVSGLEPEPPSPPIQLPDEQMQHKKNAFPNKAVLQTHDTNDKYMTEPVFSTCTTAPQSAFHILTMPERNSCDVNLQGPDSPFPSLTLAKKVVRDGLDPDAQLSDTTQGTTGHLIELSENSSDESEPLEELSDSDEEITVELRPYQENLAAPSLKKENTIICCPTGSGKTLTAAYICHRLRKEAMKINNGEKHFKTVFIVCIRNLKEQQMNNFKLLEFDEGVLATIDEESDVFEVIRSRDVVFMTAQVLVNTLKSGRLKITDLDFIIIDECHHTTKGHPYNVIMQEFYLQEKERQPIEGRGSLPQILGLTATLGVGENERPIDHCINMCANLDCKSVTHVREKKYLDNLKKYRPPLQTDKIEAVPPRNSKDPFLKIVQGLMDKICQKYKFSCNHEGGSEGYEGWAIGLKKGAETEKNWEHASAASYLVMYTRVIQTTIQLRRIDGLRVIDDEADELCPHRKSPEVWDDELRESLEERREDLKALCDEEFIGANPMIQKLRELLAKLMRDKKSRGLILARTKSYTIALVDFIRSLKMPDVHVDRIVGKANEDSQTDRRQMNILDQFRDGKINVLIGTDVVQEGLDIPKCNFVIRYNFVSNEIGSVQGKGRARHVDSRCYLIVPKGSTNEKRENANLLKVEQMEAALKELDNKDPGVLRRDILRAQDKMMEVYRNKKRRNEDPLYNIDPHSITLYHKGCDEELCKGSDLLRKSTSDYICVSEYFINNKIKVEARGKGRQFRTDTHIGVSVCNACQTELGIVKEYTYGNRLRGYLLTANRVMFSIDGEEGLRHIKKWSKVPWKISEEA